MPRTDHSLATCCSTAPAACCPAWTPQANATKERVQHQNGSTRVGVHAATFTQPMRRQTTVGIINPQAVNPQRDGPSGGTCPRGAPLPVRWSGGGVVCMCRGVQDGRHTANERAAGMTVRLPSLTVIISLVTLWRASPKRRAGSHDGPSATARAWRRPSPYPPAGLEAARSVATGACQRTCPGASATGQAGAGRRQVSMSLSHTLRGPESERADTPQRLCYLDVLVHDVERARRLVPEQQRRLAP